MQSEHDESTQNLDSLMLKQRLSQLSEAERQRVLDEAAGLWRDHDDLPDWQELRISWDRHLIDQQRLPKG